jgi:hypothetical protein
MVIKLARDYARRVRGLHAAKEKTFRPVFIDEVLIKILGYSRIDPDTPYTLADEHTLGTGSVDTALGHFEVAGNVKKVAAPFELKGPDTKDLDHIMPGRGKTPVQQAWEYANDAPGARWVLVSNCVEIRLYGYGRGREAYEVFDLSRLDEPNELRRLWEILSARNLLGEVTDRLLRETDAAYKDVTDRLYEDYDKLRERLIAFLTGSAEPKLALRDAIEPAQKILDRILFIAFAQRRDLMRDGLLDQALKTVNEFDPQPVWRNFLRLFRFVDEGGPHDLDIPPYNGGLFAYDALVDSLILPEELAKDIAKLGDWDYRREVPVTVLGHIFEKSVTDIERLRAEGRGEPPPKVTKRKKEGVVYTSSAQIIRFLVDGTIGVTLAERLQALREAHGMGAEIAPESEIAFWRAWLEVLRELRIVDPACGSGAFLVAAFDRLAQEYQPVLARLAELGAPARIDAFDEILSKNLYGVDINPESVEITRLSLWLKTARRDHRLQNLEATIRVGDSLIEDGAHTSRPFDWRDAFPHVFGRGGFDIVIGNPPYVRMELIKAFKPHLDETYVVGAPSADLYAYFYERGVRILRGGGRLGFITSSTYFRTSSGEALRRFLTDGLAIEAIVDFGDAQVFSGVTTYPVIITLFKGRPSTEEINYLILERGLPSDLARAFKEGARTLARSRMTSGAWRLEGEAQALVRHKITRGRRTLGEVYAPPLRGLLTGLNEAFIIDAETRNRMVSSDPTSSEVIHPFLRGENVQRWRVESEDLWLIDIEFGWTRRTFAPSATSIDEADAWRMFSLRHPVLAAHLEQFSEKARKRLDQGEYWWELRACSYSHRFLLSKIVYPVISQGPKFSFDSNGFVFNDKCFMVEGSLELAALLNSKLCWFWMFGEASPLRGGQWRLELREQYVSRLPIPEMTPEGRARLCAFGQTCTDAARERFTIQSAVRRRILDLAPPERARLTGKLNDWHELDFAAFRKEVKRAFRADVPVRERGEWEAYLRDNSARVLELSDHIAAAEREIDRIVYGLFDLTPDEINLLEASLEGQY